MFRKASKCPENIWEMALKRDGFSVARGMYTTTQPTLHWLVNCSKFVVQQPGKPGSRQVTALPDGQCRQSDEIEWEVSDSLTVIAHHGIIYHQAQAGEYVILQYNVNWTDSQTDGHTHLTIIVVLRLR